MKANYQLRCNKPFELTVDEWRATEPTPDSLKVYLSPDVCIEFREIKDSIGAIYRPDEKLSAEKDFAKRIQPQMSHQRIEQVFAEDGPSITAFYEIEEIDVMISLFRNQIYIANEIKVYVKDELVMPEELDDDYHDLFMEIVTRLGVEYCMTYSENADLFQAIQGAYDKKSRRLQPLGKEQLYSIPLRRRGLQKAFAMSAIGIAIMTFLSVTGAYLSRSHDRRAKIGGSLLVGISTVAAIIFKQQAAVVAEHAYSNPILADSGEDVHYAA